MHYIGTAAIRIKINAISSNDASIQIDNFLAALLAADKICDYIVKAVRRDAEEAV